MTDQIPRTIGRFEILRPLGQGGMGQVFLAKDPAIGREVALKTISSERISAPMARERFLNEAKAAGALSHPNLITIHEFGEDQGVLYLVMEYLQGEDLSVLLRRRALTQAQALEVMAQICDGLAYAHARGVLHRDVKPSNVRVVEQGGQLTAKLMDFGVARLPDSQLTGTGDRVGTLSYMAPEYLRGGHPTVQCDLYPVGMMLHEALTGELPQLSPTLPRGLVSAPQQIATGSVSDLPARLVPFIHRSLAANPGERFPSAEAFAAALRVAQKQAPGGRIALPPLRDTAPPSRMSLGWAAALLTLGTIGVATWVLMNPRASKVAEAPPSPVVTDSPRVSPLEAASPTAPPLTTQSLPKAGAQPIVKAVEPTAPPSPAPRPLDLSAAEAEVRSQPQDAWTQAERRLQEQPSDAQALALRVASLYWMGRYNDLMPALQSAKAAGLGADQLGSYPVIHAMLDDQHNTHRIPPELFSQMRAFLPGPPNGQDKNQQGPPPRR